MQITTQERAQFAKAATYGAARADVTRGTSSATESDVIAVAGGTPDERIALLGRVIAELDRADAGLVCREGACLFLRGAADRASFDRREAAIVAAVKAVRS